MSKEYGPPDGIGTYHWTKIVQSGIIKVGSIIEFPEPLGVKKRKVTKLNTGEKTFFGAPKIEVDTSYYLGEWTNAPHWLKVDGKLVYNKKLLI